MVSTAIGGTGLVVLPIWLIGEELKSGKRVPVMENYQVSTSATPQAISAPYLETDNLSVKVGIVIEFLQKNSEAKLTKGLFYRDVFKV
ncbi:MAG: hypothetical protein ACRCVV_12625 [Shewanella sp.]